MSYRNNRKTVATPLTRNSPTSPSTTGNAGSQGRQTSPAKEYLGSGTYGCVFTPPLKCKDKTMNAKLRPGLVGKVFFYKNDFKEERDIMKTVSSKVDPKGDFTVKYVGDCEIAKPKKGALSGASPSGKCSNFRGTEHQILYPDGGMDIKTFVKQNKRSPTKFLELFKGMAPVFKGLKVLHEKGLVHNDIKAANMLYNTQTKRAIMIDYGMMSSYKTVYADFNDVNNATYMYYPPEFRMFNKLIAARGTPRGSARAPSLPTLASLLEFYETAFAPIEPKELFGVFGVNLTRDLKTALHLMQGAVRRPHVRKTFVEHLVDRIDVYSLGVTLATIMHDMKLLGQRVLEKKLNNKQKLAILMIKILVGHMIRPNPFERWTSTMVCNFAMDIIATL